MKTMSSLPTINASFPQTPTRTGHSALLNRVLSTRMPILSETQPYDDRSAVDTLVVQLKLTFRQAEVLHWIAEGKTNQEIAIILNCSLNTVKSHTKEIFRHLGLHSRTAAAATAYRAHIRQANLHHPSPVRVISENREAP